MSRRTSSPVSIRSVVGLVAADVPALGALVCANLAVLLPAGSPLRVGITLGVLLVLPGYALTTAAFPARRPWDESTSGTWGTVESAGGQRRAALTGVERAALSFGLSVALLPLFGLVLQVAVGGFYLSASVALLTVFVLLALVAGVIRRARTPEDVRYVPLRGLWKDGKRSFRGADGRKAALNVVLALTVIVSMSTLGYALVAPQEGSRFTEAYLLAQQDDGQFASQNYPTAFEVGEGRPLMLAVENHEGEPVRYAVVVELQRRSEDGSTTEREELDRFTERVPDGETWRHEHEVAPTFAGERLHLVYMVFRGSPPEDPTERTAYRSVSLKIDVANASASAMGAYGDP